LALKPLPAALAAMAVSAARRPVVMARLEPSRCTAFTKPPESPTIIQPLPNTLGTAWKPPSGMRWAQYSFISPPAIMGAMEG
jgi:hypothetical protein